MLLAFSRERPSASVNELAQLTGVPISSAYRYLALLREVGLVAEAGGGLYHLTPRVLALAHAARLVNGIESLVRPVLRSLRDHTEESALFIRRLGDYAVCADLVESAHPVRMSFAPGHPMPLYGGAGAKMLLSAMSAEERDRYFGSHAFSADGERKHRLAQELPRIKSRGWATSESEVDDGVWAAAAGVIQHQEMIGVLSVAGPAFRLNNAARERILTEVRGAAEHLSNRLSHD